ncbi:MAG: GNAT family N-acetyltransferase [Salibacteraceae bacterium]
MNITVNQKEFWDFLHNEINLDSYEFKFLRSKLNRIHSKKSVLYSESLLNRSNNGWVLVLLSDSIMVHGSNWSEAQLNEVLSMIDLSRFKNYLIEGNTELIKDLLKQTKITSQIIEKERIFYLLDKVNLNSIESHSIGFPNPSDIPSIAPMLKQYYHEEYKGRYDKSVSEMETKVEEFISTNSLYILKNPDSEIVSFCTILDPDIGILFTVEKHRNKGYGSLVLNYCSNKLLGKNNEVFLMTDKNDVASKATCKKVGFKSFFEYSYLRINNS